MSALKIVTNSIGLTSPVAGLIVLLLPPSPFFSPAPP